MTQDGTQDSNNRINAIPPMPVITVKNSDRVFHATANVGSDTQKYKFDHDKSKRPSTSSKLGANIAANTATGT